jgi:hypothetical protein
MEDYGPFTEQEYREWWPLHHRSALGETLSPEEQRRYEEGRARLDATEHYPGQEEALRIMDARIEAREREERALREAEAALLAEIEVLRERCRALTGHPSRKVA